MPPRSLTAYRGLNTGMTLAQALNAIRQSFDEVDRRLAELNEDGSGTVLAAGSVTASALAASVAGAGLVLNATTNALDVNPDNSGLEVASDQVRIKALGVATAFLADLAVTTAKLADDAVTAAKIAANAVGQSEMADEAVGPTELTNALAALVQGTPSFTVGAEATDKIAVTVQLKDCDATNLGAAHVVQAWLSNSAGGAVTGTAPSGAVTTTTGTMIREWTSKTHMAIASDASGAIVLEIEEAGAATWYLNLEYQGKLFSSGAITFA